MDVEINKNGIYTPEIYEKNTELKTKLFSYFYIILTKKDKANKLALFILYLCEMIQIISFAFFQPHLSTWKMPKKSIEIISKITCAFRLSPLLNSASYKINKILLAIVIFFIFCFLIILITQILFPKDNSKIYHGLQSLINILIAPLTIFLYIPMNEMLFFIFKCYNKNDFVKEAFECFSISHIFFILLSVISIIILFSCLIFLNFLYYYPFQTEISTVKLNSSNEIIFLLVKLLYTIKIVLVKNEYISIAILVLLSFFILIKEIKNPSYNSCFLESTINVRNFISLWTFLMLLTAKIFMTDNLIYLVFIGYPIIIFTSIMFTKEYENDFNFKTSNNFHNIKSCISKTRILIKLIDSFLNKNNYNQKYGKYCNKEDIVLKGMIKIHTENCLTEDCPLKKFIKNYGNFNVQKQCLLNYMTIYFNRVMKNFPDNKILRLYYIQFNFTKKYNLNSVRANLECVKKMKNNINDEFIIYYLENEIIKMKNAVLSSKDGNESEQENIILNQKYKRLKDLIINSTKLYAEFWGIFSNNITNNLNISKLYKVGEQLNNYLNEIHYLWENNLKDKKIDIENEYIAQLYCKFLKEILLDKKKSEELQRKINHEYQMQGYKRMIQDNKKVEIENIIENQEYVLLVNSNEKGKCRIFQFSSSLTYLIGYQKHEIINKPLEVLMPALFINGHKKKVEEFIKTNHLNKISDKESFRGIEKKKTFILIKSKIGYLIPFNAMFTVFDDNDFSNSYIIKAYLEPKDIKSMYAYYILTKDDFSIDNISSSAINLGITMDLLKKYVIKLNLLIRDSRDEELNLFETYKNFEDEPKKITWVYPDLIYPKNDQLKNQKKTEELVEKSKKNRYNLQIIGMKYKENEIIGFLFKFADVQKKKKNRNDISLSEFIPSIKNEIIFDILELRYIRTIVVTKKSGFRNYRDKGIEAEFNNEIIQKKKRINYETNVSKKNEEISDEDYDDEKEKEDIILTKDKILELQGRDSTEINNFINLLPFYGQNISLIKKIPNKEEYQAGKTREPIIKIEVNKFINRIEIKIKERPSILQLEKRTQKVKPRKSISLSGNRGIQLKFFSSNQKQNDNNKENAEINLGLVGDSSITFSNIFNQKSVFKIKIINLIVYISLISLFILDFCLIYFKINNNKKQFLYLDNSYKILNNLVYSKYFITEAIITNTLPNYLISNIYGKKQYLTYLKTELANCHNEYINLEDIINSKIKFEKFTTFALFANLTLKVLTNGICTEEEMPFSSAMDRYSTQLFYISTISDLESINMADKYSYELMLNIMNDYFVYSKKSSFIIYDDIMKSIKKTAILKRIIIFLSLMVIIVSIALYYKVLVNFISDREKPINLFLTIKKNIFENLKISSENFSNKLLNKFFGNEENEEETHQDYITNIKSNDINIAKFNSFNGGGSGLKKSVSFMIYFSLLIAFFLIYELYIIIKYFKTENYFSNYSQFLEVYNTTQISHAFTLIWINIIKQYFFNETLINFNTEKNYIDYNFNEISSSFSNTIFKTSTTNSFLKSQYKDLFKSYLYKDFSNFIESESIKNNSLYKDILKNGLKPLKLEIFEILRYLTIYYFINDKRNNKNLNISDLINEEKWYNLHNILINFVKPWYTNIVEILNSSFYSTTENLQAIYISLFIVFIIVISINYIIVWKRYEEKLNNLLNKSYDLINLIPKEIKNIIISKLNE